MLVLLCPWLLGSSPGALLRALAQYGVGAIMPSRLYFGGPFPEPVTRLGPTTDSLNGVARSEKEVAKRTGLTSRSLLCLFPSRKPSHHLSTWSTQYWSQDHSPHLSPEHVSILLHTLHLSSR